jgi:hypothetical protein
MHARRQAAMRIFVKRNNLGNSMVLFGITACSSAQIAYVFLGKPMSCTADFLAK